MIDGAVYGNEESLFGGVKCLIDLHVDLTFGRENASDPYEIAECVGIDCLPYAHVAHLSLPSTISLLLYTERLAEPRIPSFDDVADVQPGAHRDELPFGVAVQFEVEQRRKRTAERLQ